MGKIAVLFIAFTVDDCRIDPGIGLVLFIEQVINRDIECYLIHEFGFEYVPDAQIIDEIRIDGTVFA